MLKVGFLYKRKNIFIFYLSKKLQITKTTYFYLLMNYYE